MLIRSIQFARCCSQKVELQTCQFWIPEINISLPTSVCTAHTTWQWLSPDKGKYKQIFGTHSKLPAKTVFSQVNPLCPDPKISRVPKFPSIAIVNHHSSLVILPSVFRQSSIKDCHSKGSRHRHAPHVYISTKSGVQLPDVCARWYTLIVNFLPKYQRSGFPCETCLGVQRFLALGSFLLCHADTDEAARFFPMPLQVIKTFASGDEDHWQCSSGGRIIKHIPRSVRRASLPW